MTWRIRALLLLTIAFSAGVGPATATTQTKFASNIPNVNDWQNESYATGGPSDCNTTGCCATNAVQGSSVWMMANDFDAFTIPAGEQITSVKVGAFVRYDTNTSEARARLRVSSAAGVIPETSSDPFIWNQGGDATCRWLDWDITGLRPEGWSQYDVNHIRLEIRRFQTDNPSTTCRVNGMRIVVTSSAPPQCSVDRHDIDFGYEPLGDVDYETFHITNTGGGTLTGYVEEVANCPQASSFRIVLGEGSYSLPAGASHAVEVEFRPRVVGYNSCQVSTGCGEYVTVHGIGEAIGACLLPGGYCEITSQRICGEWGGTWLGAGSSCPVGACILPGCSCEIFTEGECGDGNGTWSGEGSTCPEIVFPLGSSIGFPDLGVDQAAVDSFSIANLSGAPLSGNVEVGGDYFAVLDGGPFTLESGQERLFHVRFTPGSPGFHSAEVSIGCPEIRVIDLEGYAYPIGACCEPWGCRVVTEWQCDGEYLGDGFDCIDCPGLHVHPPALAFCNVPKGASCERIVTLRNGNDTPMTVSATSSCSAFEVLGPNPFVLGAEAVQEVVVRFTSSGSEESANGEVSFDPEFDGDLRSILTLRTAGPIELPDPDELTERSALCWSAHAEGDAPGGGQATATLADDTTRKRTGNSSLRFDTNGGFDSWLWFPSTRDASWSFSQVERLRIWVWAENLNVGFQNWSPWIRIGSDAGYLEYRSDHDILNEAIGNWLLLDVPIAGDSTWRLLPEGSPSLSDIDYLEIHADTWEYGFSLWFDELQIIKGTAPTDVPDAAYNSSSRPRLIQALPNPSDQAVELLLDLPAPDYVSAQVFNASGRFVRGLLNQNLQSGRHPVQWNGRDESGRLVPSGTYFLRVATSDGVMRTKVTRVSP